MIVLVVVREGVTTCGENVWGVKGLWEKTELLPLVGNDALVELQFEVFVLLEDAADHPASVLLQTITKTSQNKFSSPGAPEQFLSYPVAFTLVWYLELEKDWTTRTLDFKVIESIT